MKSKALAKPLKPSSKEPLHDGMWPIEKVIPYPKNARKRSDRAVDKVAASIKEFGWQQPIVVDRKGVIIAGHTRLLAAKKLRLTEVPVHVAQNLSPAQVKAYRLMDNRSHQESAWDLELLGPELLDLKGLEFDLGLTGFEQREIDELLAGATEGLADEDTRPEPPTVPTTKPGDLWLLGEHRALCGDSTNGDSVSRLLGGRVDMILTDPPYCSGGFQEAGRASGSVGTRGEEMVINDTLSSRGYGSLIRAVLQNVHSGIAYVFTDWRMWVNLFDVVESSGFGVRNMIVWDKGTPGMGCGWRMQHELIMCGIRVKSPFNPKKAQGNVIQCKRTGNVLHATEKPVELIELIIEVNDTVRTVCDPFGGSGTTLIACQNTGRQARVMEMDPRYCDVIVQRWQDFTGKQATLEADGRTFKQVLSERSSAAAA